MGATKQLNWYFNQWSQISAGGLPILGRKMRTGWSRSLTAILFTLNAIWAVPAVLLIRGVKPWLHVRMGTLLASRIGHFVADASIFLARISLQSQKERTVDLFWFPSRTCNDQWARMVRRKLFVRWWVRYLVWFNSLIPGGMPHELRLPTESSSREIYNILRSCTTRFELTVDEEEKAKAWLRLRGWQDGDQFVCLLVRDSAYLSSHTSQTDAGIEWSHHDYRDSDIDTYAEALQELLDRGYWVVRMGKTMHKRLSLQHKRVIDYPFAADQDDLIDIWLSANCRFFISTATGIDVVPWIYGKPLVYVNALPLIYGSSPVNHVWVPKHLRWKDSGRPLTLKEHCQHGYTLSFEYERAGIAIEDLSAAEIAAAAVECEQRVAGTWVETEEDRARQRRYWDALRSSPEFKKMNDYVHPEARVGCVWLKSMGDAFFD